MKKFFTVFRMMVLGALMLPMVSCEKEFEPSCLDYGTGHPHFIDLGLSVKWACCNVGASSPGEPGGYYAWGEIEEKNDYDMNTYKWGISDGWNGYDMTKYCWTEYHEYYDGKTILSSTDDVVQWKEGWGSRMPTIKEFEELLSQCQWSVIEYNGVECQMATGPNGNSILFPYCGYRKEERAIEKGRLGAYWSSENYTTEMSVSEDQALCLWLQNKGKKSSKDPSYPDNHLTKQGRVIGLSVRAVKD